MRGLWLLFLSIVVLSCSLVKPGSSDKLILFDISGESIYSEEFIYNFSKNVSNSDSGVTKSDIDEYLDLYINFKLKVKEARVRGMDTTQSFIDEFNNYKNQLIESYLRDDSVIAKLVQEAYDRMQYEVNVSHIIIRIQDEYDPADTLRAYISIHSIYDKLITGTDFQKLAVTYSEDPSVNLNKGNLGYFTALQMVYPFESMAYNTPENNCSSPFKTRFGYHILKVHDIRPARGKVQVAHIMLRLSDNMTKKDSIELKNKIYKIYDSLKIGGNWETLCRQYSEDMNTKNSGGILQPFETGRVVPNFSDAAFSLINPGQISEPVLTSYGWHIVKLINKYPIKSFDDIKDELTERVKRDSRSELTNSLLIQKLKKENNFQADQMVARKCLNYADSTLLVGKWIFDNTNVFVEESLFRIGEINYSVLDFFNYILLNQKRTNLPTSQVYMNELMKEYIKEQLIEYEKEHLEKKYYDYKMLVKEYWEGILLFNLMEKEVWNKALIDTTGLEKYFNQNSGNYWWNQRQDAIIFYTTKPEEIEIIRGLLQQPYYEISEDSFTVSVSDKGILDEKSQYRIDSLFSLIYLDSVRFLEVSGNINVQNAFQEYLSLNMMDESKIIFKDKREDVLSVKIVSSSKKSIEKVINKNSALTLQVESGLFQKGDHEIIDLIDWEPGLYDLSIGEVEYLVYVERIFPPAGKQLEDVKGQVISDYQNFLEKEWIKELKSKYNVNINNDALSKIYGHFKVN
jgi:peptidyl-prolyl cis-trans isomerase SurA